jgi:hypothetical protein
MKRTYRGNPTVETLANEPPEDLVSIEMSLHLMWKKNFSGINRPYLYILTCL